jgi:predicted CXXCH cytochrome family protein
VEPVLRAARAPGPALRLAIALAAVLGGTTRAEPPPAAYVGGKACAPCHEAEAKRWQGSHHDLAMRPAEGATVRGNFGMTAFTKDGVTSTFSRKGATYRVRTDGADGRLADFRVAYTFGVEPLQQYLLELPKGRYQALGIAWDTRPAAAGGQRWFHLYPGEKIDHRDPLHWTGPEQNWNYMCAECHSTNVQKGYQPKDDRFATTWSDVDVSCEACHGPGSRHVRWAEAAKGGKAEADPLRGLVVRLKDTSGGAWALAPGASIARRTKPLASRVEVETCGRCHARRAQVWGEYRPGEPLAQTYLVALLGADLYHADGQIEGEVYEYGSFLQSRMYQAGVTCSDCHDPHSGRLRAPGNAVCTQCHLPAAYDGPQHTFHSAGTASGECVSCHMIERTYMVVDGRRDHSFRVPRPDLSVKLGTPNACTDCHREKDARWAADAVAQRYGPRRRQGWHWAEALDAGRRYRADAEGALTQVIWNSTVPPIARATAVSLLARYLGAQSTPAIEHAVGDADPLVRRAAAETLAGVDVAERVRLGAPLLRDPMRTVRLAALPSLLEVPRTTWSPDDLRVFDQEIVEYRQAQAWNADRAEGQSNLGTLEVRLGNTDAAVAAFERAIRLQPWFVPAYLYLADVRRGQGRDADAEALLRKAVAAAPKSPDAHQMLGLALVRQKRAREALPELAAAAGLEPDVPRYAYVYAIALHDTGDVAAAVDALSRAHERAPASREILVALAEYEREAGHEEAARAWAQKLAELTPEASPAARAP